MTDPKKADNVNLELHRREMYLAALVFILSIVYTALEWNYSVLSDGNDTSIDDIIENIDFKKLKKDDDMVAAVSNSKSTDDVSTKIKAVETAIDTPAQETYIATTSSSDIKQQDDIMPKDEPAVAISEQAAAEDFKVMEALPEFPGGASEFMRWITANIKYPKFAQDRHIKGKIVISFIVDAEGNVTNMKIEKSPNRELGVAVLDIMQTMPKWKPGIQKGKPCATMVAVPINFEL